MYAVKKLPKGSKLGVVKTKGREVGRYDLYNLEGLSLGMLLCVKHALQDYGTPIAQDILGAIGVTDEHQTLNGV